MCTVLKFSFMVSLSHFYMVYDLVFKVERQDMDAQELSRLQTRLKLIEVPVLPSDCLLNKLAS